MALGGNPNKKGKPKTGLGGGGGTEYKGLQGNAGATYGQPPTGGNNVTNEKGPGSKTNSPMIGYAGGPQDQNPDTGIHNPTLSEVAEVLMMMAKMYNNYQPPNLTSTNEAKQQLREAQLATRKPLNEGAFYVGY